jgi:hypothetical protein
MGFTAWSFRLEGKKFEQVEYETQIVWKLQIKLVSVYEGRLNIYNICS